MDKSRFRRRYRHDMSGAHHDAATCIARRSRMNDHGIPALSGHLTGQRYELAPPRRRAELATIFTELIKIIGTYFLLSSILFDIRPYRANTFFLPRAVFPHAISTILGPCLHGSCILSSFSALSISCYDFHEWPRRRLEHARFHAQLTLFPVREQEEEIGFSIITLESSARVRGAPRLLPF